jgi:hypothetical protein
MKMPDFDHFSDYWDPWFDCDLFDDALDEIEEIEQIPDAWIDDVFVMRAMELLLDGFGCLDAPL